MQVVEIGPAINAEQHGFAIEDEGGVAVTQRGLGDQREPIGPVVPVAGPQPNTLAFALHDHPVAVVLDFVEPLRTIRNLGPAARNARFKL